MMKQIRINGIEYPCRLTVGVLKRYKEQSGKDLADTDDLFSICGLLFLAVTEACRKSGRSFPYGNAEEMMDDIELADIEGVVSGLFGPQAEAKGEKKTAGRTSTVS